MTTERASRTAGNVCSDHFAALRLTKGDERTEVGYEIAACDACRAAEIDAWERLQASHTIDALQPYGQHIKLTCKNHPELAWSTKNIDFIGARSIFYVTTDQPECSCPGADLVVA